MFYALNVGSVIITQLTLKHRDGTFLPVNFLYRPQYQELICSEGIIRLIYCISTIYLPFSDMLFRISINFKQVQDIRDAALDKSNWIDAVTVRRSQQLPANTDWGTRSREIFLLQFTSLTGNRKVESRDYMRRQTVSWSTWELITKLPGRNVSHMSPVPTVLITSLSTEQSLYTTN